MFSCDCKTNVFVAKIVLKEYVVLRKSQPTPVTLAQTESNWKLQRMIKYEFHRLLMQSKHGFARFLRDKNLDGIKLQKYQKDFKREDMAITSVFI